MRDYSKIYTSIWKSKKFRNLDSDDARYFYFYLHTCPHVNSVGCFVLPIGYATADLRWPEDKVRKAIESLCEVSLIGFHWSEGVVRIVGFLRHDPFTNAKHAAGAIKAALDVPDCSEKLLLLNDLRAAKHTEKSEALKEALDSLSEAYRTPEPEPEPEPEHSEPIGSGAAAPSVEDIPLWMIRPPNGDWSVALFRQGLAWLAEQTGKPPNSLRSLLGKWLKSAGDDHQRVFRLLAECQRDNRADPVAWTTATLKPEDDNAAATTRMERKAEAERTRREELIAQGMTWQDAQAQTETEMNQ